MDGLEELVCSAQSLIPQPHTNAFVAERAALNLVEKPSQKSQRRLKLERDSQQTYMAVMVL